MPRSLREIAIGILKGDFPPLADGVLATERLKVCEDCPQFKKLSRQCNMCGCFMDLKTKMLEAQCPAEKW